MDLFSAQGRQMEIDQLAIVFCKGQRDLHSRLQGPSSWLWLVHEWPLICLSVHMHVRTLCWSLDIGSWNVLGCLNGDYVY